MQPPGQGQGEPSSWQGESGEVFARAAWPFFVRHWSHVQETLWPAAQLCTADSVPQ